MTDPPRPDAERSGITLVDADRMNLLELMLASMITRRLEDAGGRWHLDRLRGQVLIQAGEMQVGMRFSEGRLEIRRGMPTGPLAARIRGTLTALLDAALGRRRIQHFFRGELSAWGWPTTLWHLLSLMRTAPPR
jgi:hypothetical protein